MYSSSLWTPHHVGRWQVPFQPHVSEPHQFIVFLWHTKNYSKEAMQAGDYLRSSDAGWETLQKPHSCHSGCLRRVNYFPPPCCHSLVLPQRIQGHLSKAEATVIHLPLSHCAIYLKWVFWHGGNRFLSFNWIGHCLFLFALPVASANISPKPGSF